MNREKQRESGPLESKSDIMKRVVTRLIAVLAPECSRREREKRMRES